MLIMGYYGTPFQCTKWMHCACTNYYYLFVAAPAHILKQYSRNLLTYYMTKLFCERAQAFSARIIGQQCEASFEFHKALSKRHLLV